MNARPNIARRTALVLASISAAALAAAAPALADGHGGKGSPSGSSGKRPAAATTTSPGATSGTLSVRGVVQGVSGFSVVVKQLDGSAVSVPVDRNTKIYVDGKSAHLADVKPGFVLVASWKAGKPADSLRFVRPS